MSIIQENLPKIRGKKRIWNYTSKKEGYHVPVNTTWELLTPRDSHCSYWTLKKKKIKLFEHPKKGEWNLWEKNPRADFLIAVIMPEKKKNKKKRSHVFKKLCPRIGTSNIKTNC